MKLTLRLAICITLVFFLSRGLSEESPPVYIFELSDEPVKVPYKQPKTVFSPDLSGGTSPHVLAPEASVTTTDLSPLEQPPKDFTIRMNSDETQEEEAIRGYEFYKAPLAKNAIITTDAPDPAIWLNDGDPDSPFFRGEATPSHTFSHIPANTPVDTPHDPTPSLPNTDIELPPFDPTAPFSPDSGEWSPLPWNTGE